MLNSVECGFNTGNSAQLIPEAIKPSSESAIAMQVMFPVLLSAQQALCIGVVWEE